MELKFWWSNHHRQSLDKGLRLGLFVQRMANRLMVGSFRYDKGKPIRRAKYLTRLVLEIGSYMNSGNQEHLVNAANYCFLECEAPEHPNSHYSANSHSATREWMALNVAGPWKGTRS